LWQFKTKRRKKITLPNMTIFLALWVLSCYAEEHYPPWIVIPPTIKKNPLRKRIKPKK